MSSETPQSALFQAQSFACRRCGAEMSETAEFCWACRNLVREKEPKLVTLREKAEPANLTFSLGTLMTAVTLIAVLLGLFKIVEWWTLPIVLATLTLIRGVRVIRLETETKGSVSFEERVYVFIASLGVLLFVSFIGFLASFVALFLGCTAGNVGRESGQAAQDAVIIAALVAGLSAFVFGFLLFWPRRKKSRPK